MTSPLPALPTESSPWDQALYAFLVEKGNRSGSKRTVESHSRMLWRFFADTTPERVTPAVVLAYAHGIGGTRAGVLETTFAEETETDLFGEQAVLCGGATELVVQGFQTLVEAGYQPEVAYFECMHELKLIVDLLFEGGLAKMNKFISETAQYGDFVSGPRIINDETKQRMKEVLDDITSGKFAREWAAEYESGLKNFRRMEQEDMDQPIEKVGAALRAQMSWINE